MRAGLLALMAAFTTTAAAAPLTLSHQGRLVDALGSPLQGEQMVMFHLYAGPSSGPALWTETHTLQLVDGYYATELGFDDELDSVVLNGSVRWLGVQPVGSDELTPRTPVHSAPYAIQASRLPVASSEPSLCGVTTAGATYFDTTLGQLRVCNGSEWAGTGSGGSGGSGTSCRALLASDPTLTDGIYTIDPDGTGPASAFTTRCDMSGGGWMLLAHSEREGLTASEMDAIRLGTFADYGVTGIGSPAADSRVFWLALDDWHSFTAANPSNTWRIVDSRHHMELRDLSVGPASGEYVLNYGDRVPGTTEIFNGFLNAFRGRRFTTIDNDNDSWPGNCAGTNPAPNGGWWYVDCYQHSLFNSDGNMYSWITNATQQVSFIDVWVREH